MLRKLRRIEEMRTRLEERLRSVPAAVLTTRPGPDEWSVLEVVEHLVQAEKVVLAGMDHPERLRPRRRSLLSRIGYALVMGILASPIPVKVPTRAMRPEGKRSLDELLTEWEESHRTLRRHVAAVEEGRVSGAVFRHPVSGPMTTRQTLRMLRVHLARHSRQIHRILRRLEDR